MICIDPESVSLFVRRPLRYSLPHLNDPPNRCSRFGDWCETSPCLLSNSRMSSMIVFSVSVSRYGLGRSVSGMLERRTSDRACRARPALQAPRSSYACGLFQHPGRAMRCIHSDSIIITFDSIPGGLPRHSEQHPSRQPREYIQQINGYTCKSLEQDLLAR